MIDDVLTHDFVQASAEREPELGPDAVDAADEHRLLVFALREVEKSAKSSDLAQNLRPARAPQMLFEASLQGIRQLNVHTRFRVLFASLHQIFPLNEFCLLKPLSVPPSAFVWQGTMVPKREKQA